QRQHDAGLDIEIGQLFRRYARGQDCLLHLFAQAATVGCDQIVIRHFRSPSRRRPNLNFLITEFRAAKNCFAYSAQGTAPPAPRSGPFLCWLGTRSPAAGSRLTAEQPYVERRALLPYGLAL